MLRTHSSRAVKVLFPLRALCARVCFPLRALFRPHPPRIYSSRTQSASVIKLHDPRAIRHAAGQRQEVYNAVYLVPVEHDMPMWCPTNDGTIVCGPTCVGVSLSPFLFGLSRGLRFSSPCGRGCMSQTLSALSPPCRDAKRMNLTTISSHPT